MRIKTFIATYLLFLCVSFSGVAIVSAYLTNSQINMLQEKSISQYRSIAVSFVRDMVALDARNFTPSEFDRALSNIIAGAQIYYARHGVTLGLHYAGHGLREPELMFVEANRMHVIQISGALPHPFEHYRLHYILDITETVGTMQATQNMMLVSVAILSAVVAVALYFVLTAIFRPFAIVARASRQIAGGQFGERINIKGNSEISRLAQDFNNMAEKIEMQIRLLEEEAIAKQQFVDNFAHEIRTPLTSIYGYAEYLQKTSMNEEEIIDSAEYIMSESRHIRNIANSLLELAVLRDYVPVKTEIYLAELFSDVWQTMGNNLQLYQVRLEICVGDEVIWGQEDIIKSLILNLCTNAIKACGNAGVVKIEAVSTGGKVIITVTDNGCGILVEDLQKIMDPFYRTDTSRNRERGGAGLGLALCKQIAKVHDAQLAVSSVVGEGTVVSVTFTNS